MTVTVKYQVILTPDRSSFDAARWRCAGTGESCGVWYSVHNAPWEDLSERVHRLAKAHVESHDHARL